MKHVILEVGVGSLAKCRYRHSLISGAYTEKKTYTVHIRMHSITNTDHLLYKFPFRVLLQLQNKHESLVMVRILHRCKTDNYAPALSCNSQKERSIQPLWSEMDDNRY
jgi:hypothetical protein